MNTTSRMLIIGSALALAACGPSTQADVDKAAHDRAADVAKARQDAQPAVDAANRDLAKTQQQAEAKVADAHAAAHREINKAALKQSRELAKADYDVGIAGANGDLAVALEKCKMLTGDTQKNCEGNAHSAYDQTVNTIKAKLAIAESAT
jgi:hypothetical protein